MTYTLQSRLASTRQIKVASSDLTRTSGRAPPSNAMMSTEAPSSRRRTHLYVQTARESAYLTRIIATPGSASAFYFIVLALRHNAVFALSN